MAAYGRLPERAAVGRSQLIRLPGELALRRLNRAAEPQASTSSNWSSWRRKLRFVLQPRALRSRGIFPFLSDIVRKLSCNWVDGS